MGLARSDVLDFDEVEETSRGQSSPTLVSLHFIRSALRRRWLVCVLCAVLGLLAAASFLIASPQSHTAKTTLVLAHDQESDPSRAMSTDVSLMRTRTVAAEAVASLGLAVTPDDFLKSVTVVPVSAELMSVSLSAPTDDEAKRRLTVLIAVYLHFRGEQLTYQSNVLVTGMQERTQKLQAELGVLSQRIERLAAAGKASESTLSDAIAQRAYVQGQIDTLRQSIEDATLKNASVVSSSRVIDPPATDAGGLKRRIVLILASGLIGGAALGCGTVLLLAITSDRLRRRADVAAGLEVPVPVSVGRITPVSRRLLSLPYLRKLDGHRTNERQRLARAIEMELPTPRRSGRLAVVCIDNAKEVGFAVATAAMNLMDDGRSVAVLDLTKQGALGSQAVSTMKDSRARPVVLRPGGIPTLAAGVADLQVAGGGKADASSLDLADLTLVLADLDPSIGADYLLAWTDRVMIALTAGRSSAEMVRTAGDLVRTAGLELRLAALLHAERTDDSSGTAGFDLPVATQLFDEEDRLVVVRESAAAVQAEPAGRKPVAAVEAQINDEAPATDERLLPQEPVSDEDQPTHQMQAVVDLDPSLVEEHAKADQIEATRVEVATDQQTEAHQVESGTDQEAVAEDQTVEQGMDATVEDQAVYEAMDTTADQEPATVQHQTPDKEPAIDETAAPVPTEPAEKEPAAAAEDQMNNKASGTTRRQRRQRKRRRLRSTKREVAAPVIVVRTQGDEQLLPQEPGSDDEPTRQMQPVVDLDPSLVEEKATAEIDVEIDTAQAEAAPDPEAVAEDQTVEGMDTTADQEPATGEQLLPHELDSDDDEPTRQMQAVVDLDPSLVEEHDKADQIEATQVEAATDLEPVTEDQTLEGMDTTADQEPATGEQLLPHEPVSDDEPTRQMQPVVDLDPSLVEEQATAEIDAEIDTAQAEAANDRQTEAHQVEVATDQEAVAEDQTVEDMDTTANQKPAQDQTPDKEPAIDETAAPVPTEPAEKEPAAAAEDQINDKAPATDEQLLPQNLGSDDDEPTRQIQAVVDLDPSLVEEQATAEIDAAQAEAGTDHETAAVTNARVSYEEPQTDGEPTVGGQAADIDGVITEVASTLAEQPDEEQKPAEQEAAEQLLTEYPLRNVGASPEDDFDWSWAWFEDYDLTEDADSGVTDGQPERVIEPDEVVASVELATTGWALYIDMYPAPANGFETDLVADGMPEAKKRGETVQPASNGHGSNGHEDHEVKDSGSQGQARANQISGRI